MAKTPELKAAIYARVSSDREGLEHSVQRQEADCRKLAKREGYEVVDVFVDNDISASTKSRAPRPQYEEMLAGARAKQFSVILAYSNSRLTRRVREYMDLIDLHNQHGITIKTVVSGEHNLATADGRGAALTVAVWDAAEAERTAERVKRAKDDTAKEGGYRGGPRPYGFEKNGMKVRESEAEIIREMTKAVLAGRTLAGLTKELNKRIDAGEKAARPAQLKWASGPDKGKLRGSGYWRYGALRDMLLRPRNAGLLAHGLPGKSGQKYKFEELARAKWPAIVPEEEWRAVVALLTDPARRSTTKGNETKWLGSGVYRCGAPLVKRDENGLMVKAPGADGKLAPIPILDDRGQPMLCGAVLRTVPHGGTEGRKYARRMLYRCVEFAHLTIGQQQTDELVIAKLIERLRRPRIMQGLVPRGPDVTADREARKAQELKIARFERDYFEGNLSAADRKKFTALANEEIARLDEKMGAALQRSSSSPVLRSADPAAAFLRAPVLVQRAVLALEMTVTILPAAGRGAGWRPERVQIEPIEAEPDPT